MSTKEINLQVMDDVEMITENFSLHIYGTYILRLQVLKQYLFKPPYAIGSVPSLSGLAIAYRWRSLPRVRRHRASKPQGSSKRVPPSQVTMDQLICVSLSHTQYWYDVGMLKLGGYTCNRLISRFSVCFCLLSDHYTNCFGVPAWRLMRLHSITVWFPPDIILLVRWHFYISVVYHYYNYLFN